MRSSTPSRLVGMAALVLFAGVPAGAADMPAGSVKEVRGEVTVRRGSQAIPARNGMHLFALDILETSQDGQCGAILQDGTRVSLGPNSELTIDDFIYEPVQGRFGLLLKLLRGVMVHVSGKIAEFSPESVRIETPVAVVGHRGTTLAIALEGQ